jgi:TfoX/Sxy family transcriptional regulator of competence genes
MASNILDNLQQILTEAAENLRGVTDKKMFGCYALWTNENVFALVWKHGRIGLKLPDQTSYASLLSLKGAEPWKAGPRQMAHWVLVPESFHKKPAFIKTWAVLAHQQCSRLDRKPKPAVGTKNRKTKGK